MGTTTNEQHSFNINYFEHTHLYSQLNFPLTPLPLPISVSSRKLNDIRFVQIWRISHIPFNFVHNLLFSFVRLNVIADFKRWKRKENHWLNGNDTPKTECHAEGSISIHRTEVAEIGNGIRFSIWKFRWFLRFTIILIITQNTYPKHSCIKRLKLLYEKAISKQIHFW